jgi:Tol biopolymer transport system component
MSKHSGLLCLFILCNQVLAGSVDLRKPSAQAVIRTEGSLHHMTLSPNKNLLAFTNDQGQSLRIMDLSNQDVIEVSPHRIGGGFFWSPDSVRLFYRELIREGNGIVSELIAYDTVLNQRQVLGTLQGSTGFPTLNPYDYNLYLMHEKGILQKRLEFPGERFAKWQKQKKNEAGNWVISQSAVLWLGELGLEMRKMTDDASGIDSFALSPDGRRVAWATMNGKVFAAVDGGDVQYVGEGRDPSWHPFRKLLTYAAARKIGTHVYDYDLRFHNLGGDARMLTHTQDIKERWPIWLDADTLLYTAQGTTDIFRLSFPGEAMAAKPKDQSRL